MDFSVEEWPQDVGKLGNYNAKNYTVKNKRLC